MAYQHIPTGLEGKGVLISGGTTGIGRTVALRLSRAGANVLLYGRNEPELQEALKDIEAEGKGQVHGLIADQSQPQDVQRVFERVDQKLGRLDVLVNNAALGGGSITDTDYTAWNYILQTNLMGYMHCCQLAIQRMKEHGGGHIVNIGSMSAQVREAGSDIYVASKAGIEGFSESLRKVVNGQGIKVSLIEPGLAGTEMTLDQVPREQQVPKQSEGKMLKTEDLAEAVYYVLTQSEACDIVLLQIRPHGQPI